MSEEGNTISGGQDQGPAVKDGAPPNESQKDGEFKPPKDGSWLPRDRVKEMIATAVRKATDEFSAKVAPLLDAAKAQNESKATPVQYSKAQLNEFVEAGRLTQAAADSIYEKQVEDRAVKRATEEATKAVASQHQQRTVAERMAEFQELVPDAWVDGTTEREQVATTFAALQATGIKGSKDELELAALVAAFGEPAKIRKARGFGRPGAESFEDSGSGRRRPSDEGGSDVPPRGITAKQLAHYEKGIAAGRYTGWSAVKEELKYASSKRV